MSKKKGMLYFFTVLLIFLCLNGCGKNSGNKEGETNAKNSNKKTMGRYMEKDILLPKDVKKSEIVLTGNTSDGNIQILTYKGKAYSFYVKNKNQWVKQNNTWFNKMDKKGYYPRQLIGGQDKNGYMLFINSKKQYSLWKIGNENNGEQINIAEFKTKLKDGQYYSPQSLQVLENGNIIILYYSKNETVTYDNTGKKLKTIDVNGRMISTCGNKLLAFGNNDNKIHIFDADKEFQENEIDIEADANGVVMTKNGTIYAVNSEGIHRLSNGGTMWETVVDGSLNTMSQPNLLVSMFTVYKNTFYVEYFDRTDCSTSYYEYYYDKNVSSYVENTLTVYSLTENKTIRQAISTFQKKHTDVKVNYIVAMKKDDGTTVSDQIRALNTELLAGNGADVLLLDNLPIDSYVDKGVLMNIQDIVDPMVKSNELMGNIISGCKQKDSYYSVPLRFGIPVIFGEDSLVKSNTVSEIAKAINDKQLMGTAKYSSFARFFLTFNYDKFVKGDNTIDKAALEDLLNNIKTIANNCKADESTEDEYIMNNSSDAYYTSLGSYEGMCGSTMTNLLFGNVRAAIAEAKSYSDYNLLFTAIHKNGGSNAILDEKYVPHGMAGINNATKQKELAKEFISYLLSEEVQQVDVYDGFPVNNKAFEKLIQKKEEVANSTVSTFTDGKNSYDIKSINKDKMQEIYNSALKLKNPVMVDATLMQLILDQTGKFFNGERSAEETTDAITTAMQTYLAE